MKKIKKKSFIKSCLIQNSISLLGILILCLIISTVVHNKLENSFPILENLLKYEDYLKYDEYSKIPLRKFSNCSIIIYDSNKKTLYSSDKNISEEINIEDLDYMNEEYNSKYFRVYDVIKENNEKQYYIMKIESSNEFEKIEDYAITNSNLEILEGDLFSNQKQLSKSQLNLMMEKYKNYNVEKYEYSNIEGASRTLVFFSSDFNQKNYEKALKAANNLWLISVPFILSIILVEMKVYKRNLRNYIEPINNIINSYKDNRLNEIDSEEISIEFEPIAHNFKVLIDKIEKNEIEKNIMIANISHDLKTPLTAIQGYSQAFKDNMVQESKKEQYLNAIYNKSIIATDLINRLFEYSKLEHPDYQLKTTKVNINEFSRNYFEEKYNEIQIKGFILDLKIPEEENMCYIDIELFTRLYDNLISNILKHNKIGTKMLFEIISREDSVKIIVADNGEGISDNIKKDLFKPFVTSNKARISGEGTGLGMTIIKKIVDLHEGNIYLKNNACKGYITEFNMEFKKSSL